MKKLLHKSCQWLVMLVAMFAVSFSASAQDVTITPGYNASTMTSGDVTVSGTGSYMSGYGYLVQGGQNMVVTSSGKAIVKIVVTENSNYRSYNYWDVSVGELTSTVGSKDAPIWEGNAQSVTFSNKSNPQDWEMYGVSKVEVWFGGGSTGGEVTPDPVVKPNFPVENTAYQIKENNRGMFLNLQESTTYGTILGATQEALYFTWVEAQGAFTITNEAGLYVGGSTNTWNMSSSTVEYWTVEGTEGAYKLKCAQGCIGFNDNTQINAFRNKTPGSTFSIEPYQAPSVDPVDPGTGGALNFDFSAAGNGTLTQSPVTVTYSRGSEGGKSVASLNMWNDPLVFTSTGANIVKIELTGVNLDKLTASGYTNPVWEGNAKSVTFNFTGAPFDYAYVTNAAVTLEGTPEPTRYQYVVNFTGYPDGTTPDLLYTNTNGSVRLHHGESALSFGKYITEDDIEVTPIAGYDYDVAITHPQGETFGRINVTFTEKVRYQYYIQFVGAPEGSDPTLVYTNENGSTTLHHGYSALSFGKFVSENDIEVTPIPGYTYEVVITDPAAGSTSGRITVTFTEAQVAYFDVPATAVTTRINEVDGQLVIQINASGIQGVDAFKGGYTQKGITVVVNGQSASATSVDYGSSMLISNITADMRAAGEYTIVIPAGSFEASNGDVNNDFSVTYTVEALTPVATEYTIYIYGEYTGPTSMATAPEGAAVALVNAPGVTYANGDKCTLEWQPSVTDFRCTLDGWEIDTDHSRFSDSYGAMYIFYLKRLPYKYDVIIEGNDNAGVKVNGVRYANGETVETYELLRRTDVTFLTYKGYNLITANLQDPEAGKGGVIYAKYEVKEADYASVDRTDPATGDYDLNNHLDGLSSINVYLAGDDEFTQFGYYASEGNMPEGINVTDAQGNVTNYAVDGIMSWNGYSFCIVNLAKPIREAGTYTINIPAGVLPLADEEKTSPEMHLTYNVKAATVFEIDNRDGVTAQGNRKDNGGLKTLTGFEITAPEGVTFDAIASDAKLYMQGEMNPETWTYGDPVEIEGVTFSFGTTKQTVLVNFSEPYAPEASESYTFILPAGTITATDGRTNKEISLSAYVDPVEYFDLVVTYPAEDNAAAPVDHITVQLPEIGAKLATVKETGWSLSSWGVEVDHWNLDGNELTIYFKDNGNFAQAGSTTSYFIPSGLISMTDGETVYTNSTAMQYNIPVTAAPVEYLIEFEGWPFQTHAPQVTYNGQNYNVQQHITAADLTVEDLTATDASGYEYTITIDQPGYATSHKLGRILVTYSKALDLVAVPFDLTQWAPNAQGVTVNNSSYNEIWGSAAGAGNGEWGLIRVTSANPIRKVVMIVSDSPESVMEKDNQGAFAVSGYTVTWTGNSDALVFSASEDIYVQNFVVYYEKVATVADVKLTGDYVNREQVSSIPSVLTLHLATPASATHNPSMGQTDIPEGLRFYRMLPGGEEHDVTVTGFAYFAGQDYVNITLEDTQILPGTYRLYVPDDVIPCGIGHTNEAYTVSWIIGKFPITEVTVLGNQADGSDKFTEITGLEIVPAEGLSFDEENLLHRDATGANPTVTYVVNDDEVTVDVTGAELLENGHIQIFFDESIESEGDYVFTLSAGVLIDADYFVNAEVGNIRAVIDNNEYFDIIAAYGYEDYNANDTFNVYAITSNWEGWEGILPDITKQTFIDGEDEDGDPTYKKVSVRYYDPEQGYVTATQEIADFYVRDNKLTLIFDENFTVPFDTEYTISFPKGFITLGSLVSNAASFDHKMSRSYAYTIVYDDSVPEDAYLYNNEFVLNNGVSYGGISESTAADFTATPVKGMTAVITVVQPEADNNWEGTITLSYETIEPVLWDGEFTVNGTPSNLGKDWLCSITSFTLPAPEGHTFASAEDCAMLFKGNLDTEYEPYEVTATISEDGSEVTITLSPAYSTPSFGNDIALADGSLILDNGAPYDGFNYSFTLFPEYAFNIDHTDPADSGAAIYNGELNAIDVYLPAGVYPYTNTELGIEVTGKGYVESFSCTGISNWGDFHRIQLPAGMSLPTGRVVMTIPAGMFYYTSNEDGQTYQNAPYTLWLDNYSALQLVAEPAAGTVVGLDAIRVKGERGTLWTADTDAEALAQHITFGTWEGPVAVTTAIENGVLVVTPVETLAEGNYTLTIDGLAGFLESADVAASVNAPARFEFNVVGSTFAFQGAQPYDGKIISDIHELETINLRFSTWTVGNVSVSEAAGNEPILVTLIDGEGIERTVIKTYPAVGEDEWGTPVAQLVGEMLGFTSYETADGKYNVSLTIPAGMFISDNGRTNEAMTLHYVYDSNKYFAVEPNFEPWGTLTGPVKTFTLTAAEGVTFTGIAPDKVDDPENGVDRPTVFNNSGYVTYAIPTISADGKSVTLALAEPLKNAEQYYLVVPEGLFIGTVTDENNRPATAINRGIGAWQQVFYVDAPVYEYAIINGGTTEYQSGDVLDESDVYNVFFPIAQGVDTYDYDDSGVTLTDAEGNNIEINGAWRGYFPTHGAGITVQFNGSLTEEGTYHVHIPAGSFKDDNGADIAAIDFEFVISKFYNVFATDEDKTFTVLEYIDVDSRALYEEDNYAIDVTKLCINTHEYDSNWQFIYAPVAVSKYEVVTVDPGVPAVRFYLETPITVANSYEFKFKAGLFYGAGFQTREMKATLTVDPVPNDISRDGNEDLDDVDAIADIILRNEGWYENNTGKADLNNDGQVSIGDLVKYIEYLKTQSAEDNDTPIDEEEDEEL